MLFQASLVMGNKVSQKTLGMGNKNVSEKTCEEDGSRRELGPAPNPPYLAPLLTDTCPILEVF